MTRLSEKTSASIQGFLERWMEFNGAPGISVAITDREGQLATYCMGRAEVEANRPVTPNTLFQIGSVSKSFTCIAVLQLVEDGVIDVHEKVVRYLPWFRTRSGFDDITVHHLMTHTAGLIMGSDSLPTAEYEILSLSSTDAIGPKGTHFHYSNAAYKTLGVMLERLTGKSYETIIREKILAPLGMDETEAVIYNRVKMRSAVGYSPLYDDRPFVKGRELIPATWFESNTGDGSISSTGKDMCAYIRMLMNHGAHAGERILSEDSFEKMTSPYVVTEDGVHGRNYGYGLNIEDMEGDMCLGHQGGMVGFYTSMLMNMVKGIGVIVTINGPGNPYEVARNVLRLAISEGATETLEPRNPAKVTDREDWQGKYVSRDKTIEFVPAPDHGLSLRYEGEERRAMDLDDHFLYVDSPGFELFPFRLHKKDGHTDCITHGSTIYAREGESALQHAQPREGWTAYQGHYRSHNPWLTNFRVVLRGPDLFMITPDLQEERLIPLDDGTFRIGEHAMCPERIAFESIIEGRALVARISGGGLYGRTFTP